MRWLRRRAYVPIWPGDVVRVVGSEELRAVTSMGGFGNSPMDYFLDGAVVPCRVWRREDLVFVMRWPR